MVPEYGFLLPLSAWPDALYISSPLSIQQNGHASRPGPLCPASLLDCRQNLTNTELTLDIPDCIDPFLIQNIDHSASNLSIHPKIETSSAEPTTLRNVPSDTLDDWQGCPAVSASHIQVPTPELSKRRSSSVSSVLERHTLPSSNPDVERMLWEEWLGHATPDIVTKHESADTSSNSNHVDHWTACATFRHHARQRRAVFSLSQKIQQPNDSDMEIDSDTSDAPDALPWLQDGDELVRPFGTSSSGLKSAWAEKQMERCLSEARVIVSRDKQRGDVLATNEECRAREQHAQEFINNARRSPRKKAKKEQRHPALPLSPSQSCKKVESVSTALVVFGQRLDPPPSQGRRISHRHNELAEPLLQMPYPHPQPPRKRTSTPRTEAKTSMQPVGETPELSGASHDRKSEKRPRKRQRVGRASSSRSLRLQRPSQEMQPVASTSSAASLATPGDEISHVSSSTTGADAMSLIDPIFNEPEYLATTQVVLSQKPAQLTAPSQSQYSLQTEHTQSESSLAQSTNTSSKGKRPTRGLIPEPVAEDRFGPPIQHRKSHNSCSSRLDEQERANDKLDSTVVALPHSQALVPVSLPLIDPDLLGEIWSTQSPSLLADQKAPRVMSPGVSSALSSVGTSTTGPSRTSLRDKWTKRPRKRAKPLPRVRVSRWI